MEILLYVKSGKSDWVHPLDAIDGLHILFVISVIGAY